MTQAKQITASLNSIAGVRKTINKNVVSTFKRTIRNIDGINKTFTIPESYKKYVGAVWAENEEGYPSVEDAIVPPPLTLNECDAYIIEYCANLEITTKQ